MKAGHNDSSVYCDAAIATSEDIEMMWANMLHCNKTSVGKPFTYVDKGIPMSDAITQPMTALLQKIKNRGEFHRLEKIFRPTPICPQTEMSEENMSLTVNQLSGLWVITAFFLIAGLIAPLFIYDNNFDTESKISDRDKIDIAFNDV